MTVASILRPQWVEPKTKEQLLTEWHAAKDALDNAKNLEASLRQQVVDAFPFETEQSEGTQRLPLANGWQLKVVKKFNYTLANADGQTDNAIDKLEALGEASKYIASRLVKWKPELSVSEYRQLTDEQQEIINSALTIKPGLPTLELVPPKV